VQLHAAASGWVNQSLGSALRGGVAPSSTSPPGYLGALLQPHMPDTALRKTLGLLATGLAASYLINAIT